MNNEELLAKAKRDYPIGTIFKSAYDPERKGICKGDFWYTSSVDGVFAQKKQKKNGEAVYYAGKWAEIIYSPIKKQYKIH